MFGGGWMMTKGSIEWSAREPPSPGGLSTYYQSPAALARADALLELAAGAGLAVRRLSVRRREPHLQIHLDPPDRRVTASQFFEAVRALGARTPP